MLEILTPREMADVDRLAIAAGPFSGPALMQRAAGAVAALVLSRFGEMQRADVLCGPGNNGGDGYVVADILRRSGVPVAIYAEGSPRPGSDAELAASACMVAVRPLREFAPVTGTVIIDALYGAGLDRAVSDAVILAADRSAASGCPVIAIDLPSGISGESGAILGGAFMAAVTVTFVRLKPCHLLQPGRTHCGAVVLADIGIGDATVEAVGATCFDNQPTLWRAGFPSPHVDTHKYARGHVSVVSGAAHATGAARLSALASLRAGAGAVTLLSPSAAMDINAAHLTAIMLRQAESAGEIYDFVARRRSAALVFGPGLDPGPQTAATLRHLVTHGSGTPEAPESALVIDAGALTALAGDPEAVFAETRNRASRAMVLTPHEGEFARVFPDIAADRALSKLERARRAARRSNAVIVYKGPDTVIARPDGRAAINGNGTPFLATAGSGDVLSGIIAGLAAQGMPLFEASCAAVWLHAEAAARFGPGLIAEDLPLALLPVLRELHTGTLAAPT